MIEKKYKMNVFLVFLVGMAFGGIARNQVVKRHLFGLGKSEFIFKNLKHSKNGPKKRKMGNHSEKPETGKNTDSVQKFVKW